MRSINYITELIKRAKKNDINAQKMLYEIYIKEMLLLSYRLAGNIEDAKDIVQDSFINAFVNIKKLNSPDKFKQWLKRIVINNCFKRLNVKTVYEDIELANEHDDTEEDYYKSISFDIMNMEIDKLPTGCRQVLTLYLFEDFKHKEIAEIMNISESTSKSQYQRALKLLKERFKKYLT